jgi:hypothetical protein
MASAGGNLRCALDLAGNGRSIARDLLASKVEYLQQAAAASAEYLKAIDAEVARLESAGDDEAALELKTHRGAWLLGDITAEEYREFEADGLSPEQIAAVEAYIAGHAVCRQTLEAGYQQVIDAAKAIRLDDEAAGYQSELETFQSGTYAPTPVEVIKPKPYDVRRVLLEPPLVMPASATKIPDELFVEFREQGFCISGTKRTDTATIDGKERGHFGKGVAFIAKQEGARKFHGYFMIGALEDEGSCSVFTANKLKFTPILPLDDLELDTVYEWTVETVRDEFRVEVRHDGEVVKTTRAFGGAGSVFGFCATVRYEGSQARIVVAVE